ncbi:hypothetical protein C4585_02610 [Candidatus Parcubacteria bacterium]|nr:MAG: hypothetical protein C4585_02610 [Candidatus Parcubacteria bacterium]
MQQLDTWLNELGPFTPFVVAIFAVVVLAGLVYFLWRPILWIVHQVMTVIKFAWHIQLWTYPIIMLAVGFLMTDLRAPASFNIPLEARGNVLILCGVGVVLFILQMFTANSPGTTLRGLIMDFVFSALWAIVLGIIAGAFWGMGKLEFWLAIPTLFVIADLFINTVVTIRNAYQREPIAIQTPGA